MKEIIFRGKRVDNGKWVQGYLFETWGRTYICWGTTNDIPNTIEVIPDTVGQFIGCRDKNGTLIFNGDIVLSTYGRCSTDKIGLTRIGIIEYKDSIASYRIAIKDSKVNISFRDTNEIEVLGNIYDNSELPSNETVQR